MQTKKRTLNYKKWFLPILCGLFLASCTNLFPTSPSNPTEVPSTEESTTDPSEVTNPSIDGTTSNEPSVELPSEETTSSDPSIEDPSHDVTSSDPSIEDPSYDVTSNDPSIEDPSQETTPSDPSIEDPSVDEREGKINFDIYTINDFHGATQYKSGTYPQIGLAKMSNIYRSFAEESTSFLLSSGDSWQETIESNTNYGAYVTEAFNIIGLDAMAIGNHEFDWGVNYIKRNAELANYPFLAANIYDVKTGELLEGTTTSTIIERDGLKVGVIGVIGPAQYSSISYQYVAEYEFRNEYKIVVDEAEKLRNDGADVIVLSSHDGWTSDDYTTVKQAILDEAKIDLVISGHTHKKECTTYTREDGYKVPVLQAYSSATAFGHVDFTYDFDTESLKMNSYSVKNFKDYDKYGADQRIIDLYNEKYNVDDLKTEHIVKVSSQFSTSKAGILGATAIYEKIRSIDEYASYDIIAGYHNSSREAIPAGDLNFEELFASYPFDNEIILYTVNSSYIQRGYYYYQTKFNKNQSFSGTRYIAAIDYLAYKTVSLEKGIRTGLYARDIIKEYLQNKSVINPNDYTN